MEKIVKLFNKNFVLLWQGQFVSRLGSQVFLFAMILWIKNTFHSTSLVGLLGMVSGIPAVILSAVGGTVADRYSRRKIIIFCDILDGITILVLSALFFLLPEQTDIILISLFAASIISASISAFFGPAIAAAIPDIVPEDRVAGANSLGQLSMQISQFIGMGAGAQLLLLLGAPLLTVINAITFIFSGISELFISIPQEIPEKVKNIREQLNAFKNDIGEGLKYILENAGLKKLVFVSIFMAFFSSGVMVLLPFFVEDFLKVSDDWFGFLLIAYGLGTTIGYMVVGIFRMRGVTRQRFIILFMILESATYIALGLISNAYHAVTIMFIGGIFNGFIVVCITTLLQITTPSAIRGRVFGVVSTIAGSIAPLGMGLSGLTADLIGQNIPLIFIICGIAMVALSILVSISRDFRKFMSYESEEEEEPTGFYYTIKMFESSDLYVQNQ